LELILDLKNLIFDKSIFESFGGKEKNFSFLRTSENHCMDKEAILMPYLEALANFREIVRSEARTSKNINILKVYFFIW